MIARIYAKTKDMKRFRPLDLSTGSFVVNLIHASTFWNDVEIEHAETKILPQLRLLDPTIEVELRKAGNE